MKAYFKKIGGLLVPTDEQGKELLRKVKNRDVVSVEFKRPRNYKFLQKFMCMVNVGYEAFEPEGLYHKGELINKEPEQFRKDCTILAGYRITYLNINGEPRYKAKSLSFGSMGEDEFEKVYSAVANVILQKVLTKYTREDLDQVVQEILDFT